MPNDVRPGSTPEPVALAEGQAVGGRGRPSPRPSGLAMASVLAAMLLAFSLWALCHRSLSHQVTLEQYTLNSNSVPDIGTAMAHAIACFRVSPPTTDPYECKLTLGKGSQQKSFLMSYKSGTGETIDLTVSVYDSEPVTACPDCSGAAR